MGEDLLRPTIRELKTVFPFLVPIPAGQKGPNTLNWNLRENCQVPDDWTGSVGIAHRWGGTCAIDLDQLTWATKTIGEQHGVDLQSILGDSTHMQIYTGTPDRAKVVFQTFLALPTKSVKHNGHDAFQFRCGTKDDLTVQDVVSGWHSDNEQWIEVNHLRPQLMPPELLQVWQTLLKEPERPSAPAPSGVNVSEAIEALNALDPDMVRDDWVQTGMSLHSLSPDLYGEWDAWSAGGAKYTGDHDTSAVWRSFGQSSNPITIRSLFKMAAEAGWHRQVADVSAGFSAVPAPTTAEPVIGSQSVAPETEEKTGMSALLRRAQRLHGPDPLDDENNREVRQVLWEADGVDPLYQLPIHDAVRSAMGWTKGDLQKNIKFILQQMQVQGAERIVPQELQQVLSEFVYVSGIDQFFRPAIKEYLTPEAFRRTFSHLVPEKGLMDLVIEENQITKVGRIDYVPGLPSLYEENGAKIVNLWTGILDYGQPGDCTPWLNHFDVLGWNGEKKEHILKWMAHTLRHPEKKINHIILLGGGQGNGKDFLLHPLKKAMGENCGEVEGDVLLEQFNDYLLGRKYLHINEVEHGDHRDAERVIAKLKPMASAPPDTLSYHPKGVKRTDIRNVVNISMTSNRRIPMQSTEGDRRLYPVWTDVTIRGVDGQVTKEWQDYWRAYWPWMRHQGGWQAAVHYLMTQVDLTNWDAGEAPPVTDFLREMQEANTDPLTDLIKAQMEAGEGLWGMPLLTSGDLHNAIVMGGEVLLNRYGIRKIPGVNTIGKVMRRDRLAPKIDKSIRDGGRIRLWAMQDAEAYQALTGRELRDVYEARMDAYKTTRLTAV